MLNGTRSGDEGSKGEGAEKFENETQNVHVTCKYFTKAECLSIYAPFADAGCQSNKSLVW